MSRVERVLVVGAGISGMVLGTALKKAGKAPDIIELQPEWDVLGVGISIQGPALRALRSIGLIDRRDRGLDCSRRVSAVAPAGLGSPGKFMVRRYERCRIVVENSWQLGEWGKSPDTPGADPTALIAASMKALAAPI